MTANFNYQNFNSELLDYIQRSPTPFHATRNLAVALRAQGFEELLEQDAWSLKPGGKYYLTRNDSSIIAFIFGGPDSLDRGIRMVGAHTDSPNLRIKPLPEKIKEYFQLGVEVYGGALLNPWFDRDLSIAGRVIYREKGSGKLTRALIDFKAPVATIPSLAIHLDREANTGRTVNPQTDIPPILFEVEKNAGSGNKIRDFREILARQLAREQVGLGAVECALLPTARTPKPTMTWYSSCRTLSRKRRSTILECGGRLRAIAAHWHRRTNC